MRVEGRDVTLNTISVAGGASGGDGVGGLGRIAIYYSNSLPNAAICSQASTYCNYTGQPGTASSPAGAGTYDDADGHWIYSGTWRYYAGSGPLSNTLHYTDGIGDSAELRFNGASFVLTYTKANNRGLIDVYVDGVKAGTINAYSASTLWQQIWTSQVYPAGEHTVRLVHAGNSGTYIDVDAIQIYGSSSLPTPTAPTAPQGWYASDYTYSTDAPHAVTSVNRGPFTDFFSYDENGNMTCRTESGVTYLQTYNAENRIASIAKLATGDCSTPGTYAAKWDFTYDGDGTRTGQAYTAYINGTGQPPVITRYYFGGAYETTGSTWKKYYSFGGATLMRDADGFKYFLSDQLGSVSVVLSATGTVLEQQRYLPFGQARVMPPYASVTSTDFTYTGQRNLSGTGLMDYKARFYSVSLGRFIQPDSIIPSLAVPQSLNRFSYVVNRPLRYTDPTGYKCNPDDGCETPHGDKGGADKLDKDDLDKVPKNPKTNVSGSDYYDWYQELWLNRHWSWWTNHSSFSVWDFITLVLYAELDNVGDPAQNLYSGYEPYREGVVRAAYEWCESQKCNAGTPEGALNWLAAYSQSGAGRFFGSRTFDSPTHTMDPAILLANSMKNPAKFGEAEWAKGWANNRPYGVGNKSLYDPRNLNKAIELNMIFWRSGQGTGNEVIIPTACGSALLHGENDTYEYVGCGDGIWPFK